MSSDVRSVLKEARELLKQNQYAEAVKRCKKVLKIDRTNYGALVLLGVAMREIEELNTQAPLALEKAIDIQPENPLAWHGLVAYYEKEAQDEAAWIKLVSAYCKLLQLDSQSPKFPRILDKVSNLCLRVKSSTIIRLTIELLQQVRTNIEEDKLSLIDKTLAWILTEYPSSMNDFQDLLLNVLASVTKDTHLANRQEYYRQYLKVLYELSEYDTLLTEAAQMYSQYQQDYYPLEWICRVYYELHILTSTTPQVDISQFYDALLRLDVKAEAANLAKALHLQITDNLINSRECLNQIVLVNAQSFYAWVLLSIVNFKLHCWDDVEIAATQALKMMQSNVYTKLQCKIEVIWIKSMCEVNVTQKLEKAAVMCEKLLAKEYSIELEVLLIRTKVLLNKPDACIELNKLEAQEKSKVDAVFLKALDLKRNGHLEEAADVLGSVLESSETWLLLGKIYWEMADYNHSLMAFLNGIQADRYNWKCLVYLGRYYREYGNDIERSRKCYQRALQINPNSDEAGIGLSTAYRLLKNSDGNIQLLQKLTTEPNGPKWAWLQLGLQYLDQGSIDQAIKALQHVIRADPNDNHSWESLGDAYLNRGAYTSALKSYQRALELYPESLYSMIQVAYIKLIVGQYEQAKEDFELILENQPRYVPALKGLAETCLGLAKQNMTAQFLGRVRENLQQAANILTKAITESNNLSCIWKLLGNVCYKTAILSNKYCFLNITSALVKLESTEENFIVKRQDLFSLSTRCYCRALSLCEDSSLLWHDLACCYFTQVLYNVSTNRKATTEKSFAAAKQAIKIQPSSWMHWNVLGVISMAAEIKNYALAQHCYVMAIDKEPNSAVAWTNLGSLYLHLGDIYKANEAFSRAQRVDPAYINSWVGQGLIAEKMNRKEAMDLFRHSTQLGYHNEAALGYAHWVLTVLLSSEAKKDPLYTYSIENMHAIPIATDMLNWYIEHCTDNAYAFNTYGLLLERQKLYKSAADQFATALRKSSCDKKDYIRINLARVLMHLTEYMQAIQLCRSVTKATFNSQCHLAISLFKAKEYEESYTTYESALQWLAATEFDKANSLCAMATMAYAFQGVDDAKTLLFQCIQMQPPVVAGFLATASLGILHGDVNLTALILNEITTYKDHPKYGHHIAKLSAYSYCVQNDVVSGIRTLSKAIQRHPNDSKCWITLARILLEVNQVTFNVCAEKALFFGRNDPTNNMVQLACALSLCHCINSREENGLRTIQKTLFAFPGHIGSWAVFVAALLSRCISKKHKPDAKWVSELIGVLCKSFDNTQQMRHWLDANKKEADNISNQIVVI